MKKCELSTCSTTVSDNAPSFCDEHNQFNSGFIRKHFSSKIQLVMDELNISKKELAIRCGVQPSVITKWVSGTHNFTIDSLTTISGKLGKMLF